MAPTVLIGASVAALAVGLGGFFALRGRAAPVERAPAVTRPEDLPRLVERVVFLALELCRVDGAIGDTEMRAIEQGLVTRFGVSAEDAPRTVNRVLRATQHAGALQSTIEEIARLAGAEHRAQVVDMMRDVAAADETLVEEEVHFLDRVERRLGSAR